METHLLLILIDFSRFFRIFCIWDGVIYDWRHCFFSNLDAFSFSCLVNFTSISRRMFNRSDWRKSLSHSCSWEGSSQSFTVEYDVSCSFIEMCFIRLRKFPSSPSLLNVFIMKGVGLCQMLFLHLLRWPHSFGPLFYNKWLWSVKSTLYSRDTFIIFLICC